MSYIILDTRVQLSGSYLLLLTTRPIQIKTSLIKLSYHSIVKRCLDAYKTRGRHICNDVMKGNDSTTNTPCSRVWGRLLASASNIECMTSSSFMSHAMDRQLRYVHKISWIGIRIQDLQLSRPVIYPLCQPVLYQYST